MHSSLSSLPVYTQFQDAGAHCRAMRNPHHHQQLLASLKCFIIIFEALLLNGRLAKGDEAISCYVEPSARCPYFKNNPFLFPFTSKACAGSASSFLLSGCHAESNSEKPTWLNFVNASSTTPGPTYVLDFTNPFTIPSSSSSSNQDLLLDTNSSSNSSIFNHTNSSNASTNASSIKPFFGVINLTWSETLISKTACESPAPLNQIISDYLPQSINLTSFAHSAFQLTPSNIILLFNCTPSSPVSNNLRKDSKACNDYENGCKSQYKESWNCYQYIPPEKELNLPEAMKGFNCTHAMFFVIPQLSIPVLQWKPGLIELNWSTSNSWIASNRKSCEGCLQTNGSCGYNSNDTIQCYCTSCSTNNTDRGCSFTCIARKFGFGAAGFAIALSLSLTLFCICKRKVFMKTGVPYSSHINKSRMKKPSFLLRKQDPISAKEMSYQEIVNATESFAETHMLGDGGYGAVYEGVLADGCKVAVKRLYHGNYRRMEQFYNEIKVLSNLDHPNLVKLYGFCCEDEKELLLVFEYAPQGTVSDHLHNESKPPMSWNLRLDIACETANALSYLHNSVIPPIYHRDVKTTNILLDEGLHAKLADFGLSKFVPLKATHVSTAPQGTPGYLDPDYHQCYQLTDKSDVYSLGVVLMELISAKPAVDMSRERGEINLSALAVMKIKCGQLEDLVDPTLEMKKNLCVERSINRVVELAFQCLHAERDERPSMRFVAETLAKIRREHAQNEDGDGEDLPNTHTSTQSIPTTCQSCVSNGPKKPFQHLQDSPCSVVFSTGSSNPSSLRSSS